MFFFGVFMGMILALAGVGGVVWFSWQFQHEVGEFLDNVVPRRLRS